MIILRGKNKEEILNLIENTNFDNEEEIYINQELSKEILIALLEDSEIETIYLPKSKYKRTREKILNALQSAGVDVIPKTIKIGRPTEKDKLILKYKSDNKTPEEITNSTGLNLKTVQYHYYKKGNNE